MPDQRLQLLAALGDDGVEVRALTRRPERSSLPVQALGWDGRHFAASAIEDCRAVVHLAGEPVFGGTPTRGRMNRMVASRVDSTKAIVEASNNSED